MPVLLEAFQAAPEVEQRVCWLGTGGFIHKTMASIIERAGVTPWPDLWQALRRSCEIDWAKEHPQFAVSRWIGHSITVSGTHYANHVPDELYAKVSGLGSDKETGVVRQTERAGVELSGIDKNPKPAICGNPSDSRPFRFSQVGATRFELATSWTQTTRSSQAELRPEISTVIVPRRSRSLPDCSTANASQCPQSLMFPEPLAMRSTPVNKRA